MIKVVMIARTTLYKVPGGDTVQIIQTAKSLAGIGVSIDVRLTDEKINYKKYDLLHFFNISRPADILHHIKKSEKPFVVSPILIDYSEFDKQHRKGISGLVFKFLSADAIEYLKTLGRCVLGKDKLISLSYLWMGQRKSIKKILKETSLLLPNSQNEYNRIVEKYKCNKEYIIVPNGIDPTLFQFDETIIKGGRIVICVARIEGIKNQLNLIKALNNTAYNLFIIGSPAPNQISYYNECKRIAANNITFIQQMPQEQLIQYYQKAKVHVLPSWFETTGLSSLEAAALGCSIVITDKGDAKEYFEDDAFYCDPSSPQSIFAAVEKASSQKNSDALRKKILANYTWQQAALQTQKAYKQVIENL